MDTAMFFSTQIAFVRDLAPAMQRATFDFAVRTKNVSLLAQLAGHRDLLPDLDEALSTRTELPVLAAWSARPGRTADEVAARFAKEKRATLLASLASAQDLPEAVYRQVAKAPAMTLRWALLENPSVPLELKLDVADDLAVRFTATNGVVHGRASALIEMQSEVFARFVEKTENVSLLGALSHAADRLPADRALPLARRLAALVSEGVYDALPAFYRLVRVDDPLSEVLDLAAEALRVLEASADAGYSLPRNFRAELDIALQRRDFDLQAELARVTQASSAADLDARVNDVKMRARALSVRVPFDELAAAILDCPSAGVPHLQSYGSWMRHAQAEVLFARARARDDRALAHLVLSRASVSSGDLFAQLYRESEDPEGLLRWLLEGMALAPAHIAHSLVVREDPALALRVLPAATVLTVSLYAADVERLLVSEFGDDAATWATFTSLATEWEGSLPDLVVAARAFSNGNVS